VTPIRSLRGRLRDAADHYLAQCFAGGTPPHVNEFARVQGLTPRSLGRQFKAEAGVVIGTYFRNARIQQAQRLLSTTGLPMSAIASASGFGTRSTFFVAFRRATGMTPEQFRYRNR
jgi:AraC family transcriptional regulator